VTAPTIEEEVPAFVAEFAHFAASKITPKTTLFGDVGVDGDDGHAILTAFAERFQVDMSACRPVHFGPEGILPWTPFLWIRQA